MLNFKSFVFDTETSGLPNFKLPADDPSQPRLASLAMILVDENLEIEDQYYTLVKPEGWVMQPGAAAVNGLDDNVLLKFGRPIRDVLDVYESHIKDGRVAVAFNSQFDCKIMRGEFRRAGRHDLFEETPNICIMRTLKAAGHGGKLHQVYAKLFGKEPPNQHSAMGDTVTAYKLFRSMHDMGIVPEPQVYYSSMKVLE